LGTELLIPKEPVFGGSVGAALTAAKRIG